MEGQPGQSITHLGRLFIKFHFIKINIDPELKERRRDTNSTLVDTAEMLKTAWVLAMV